MPPAETRPVPGGVEQAAKAAMDKIPRRRIIMMCPSGCSVVVFNKMSLSRINRKGGVIRPDVPFRLRL